MATAAAVSPAQRQQRTRSAESSLCGEYSSILRPRTLPEHIRTALAETRLTLELADFLINTPPPRGNCMSSPLDVRSTFSDDSATTTKKRSFRVRKPRAFRSHRLLPPRQPLKLRLPDCAVAATTIGGARFIAISIPIEASQFGDYPRSQYPIFTESRNTAATSSTGCVGLIRACIPSLPSTKPLAALSEAPESSSSPPRAPSQPPLLSWSPPKSPALMAQQSPPAGQPRSVSSSPPDLRPLLCRDDSPSPPSRPADRKLRGSNGRGGPSAATSAESPPPLPPDAGRLFSLNQDTHITVPGPLALPSCTLPDRWSTTVGLPQVRSSSRAAQTGPRVDPSQQKKNPNQYDSLDDVVLQQQKKHQQQQQQQLLEQQQKQQQMLMEQQQQQQHQHQHFLHPHYQRATDDVVTRATSISDSIRSDSTTYNPGDASAQQSMEEKRRVRKEKVREIRHRDMEAARSRPVSKGKEKATCVNDTATVPNNVERATAALHSMARRGEPSNASGCNMSPIMVVADLRPSTSSSGPPTTPPPDRPLPDLPAGSRFNSAWQSRGEASAERTPQGSSPFNAPPSSGPTPPHSPESSPVQARPPPVPFDRTSLSRRKERRESRRRDSTDSDTRLALRHNNEQLREMEDRLHQLEHNKNAWLENMVPLFETLSATFSQIVAETNKRLVENDRLEPSGKAANGWRRAVDEEARRGRSLVRRSLEVDPLRTRPMTSQGVETSQHSPSQTAPVQSHNENNGKQHSTGLPVLQQNLQLKPGHQAPTIRQTLQGQAAAAAQLASSIVRPTTAPQPYRPHRGAPGQPPPSFLPQRLAAAAKTSALPARQPPMQGPLPLTPGHRRTRTESLTSYNRPAPQTAGHHLLARPPTRGRSGSASTIGSPPPPSGMDTVLPLMREIMGASRAGFEVAPVVPPRTGRAQAQPQTVLPVTVEEDEAEGVDLDFYKEWI